MRYLIALTLFMTLTFQAEAQTVQDPRAWGDDFMQTLINDGADAAYKKLQQSTVGMSRPEDLPEILDKMRYSEESFGKGLGYEFLAQKEIGQSLIIISFLSKREVRPVFWRFTFYSKQQDGWELLHFGIVSKFGKLDFL